MMLKYLFLIMQKKVVKLTLLLFLQKKAVKM